MRKALSWRFRKRAERPSLKPGAKASQRRFLSFLAGIPCKSVVGILVCLGANCGIGILLEILEPFREPVAPENLSAWGFPACDTKGDVWTARHKQEQRA